jgi:hypothetical protein
MDMVAKRKISALAENLILDIQLIAAFIYL